MKISGSTSLGHLVDKKYSRLQPHASSDRSEYMKVYLRNLECYLCENHCQNRYLVSLFTLLIFRFNAKPRQKVFFKFAWEFSNSCSTSHTATSSNSTTGNRLYASLGQPLVMQLSMGACSFSSVDAKFGLRWKHKHVLSRSVI